MATPIHDIEHQIAFWDCIEKKLKAAHRSGGRITDAEAEAVWHCPEVQAGLHKAGLDGEPAVRRLYDHIVARSNTDGGKCKQPDFPQSAVNYATHNLAATSRLGEEFRHAYTSTHVGDKERLRLINAYDRQLTELGVPVEVRRTLIAFQQEQLDHANAYTSYQMSEVCQHGSPVIRKKVAEAGERIAH